MIQIILASLSLPLCVALLQFHGIAFWTWGVTRADPVWGVAMLMAPWNGWGWSVMLEIVNLWAWSRVSQNTRPIIQGAGWIVLAAVTTALLVAGPLYRVATPLVREIVSVPTITEGSAEIEYAKSEITAVELEIKAYSGDWRLRPLIEARMALLRALYARLNDLIAENTESAKSARLDGLRIAVIAGQLAVIVVAQVGAVLAIVTLFGGVIPNRSRPRSERASRLIETRMLDHSAIDTEAVIAVRKDLILKFAKFHGLRSQNMVANHVKEPQSTFSEYANNKATAETAGRITGKLQLPSPL